ncbi:MAG TPA: type IV secretion system DNA-binding domain-containing protein [Blastocatellia bacterium]|nr:type IV secretion system DNA-binding domain-containing protein [Blastocatellia bacterium]
MFTEEGRTRLRNFRTRLRTYLIVCAIIGAVVGGLYWRLWMWNSFRPLEKVYFPAYIVATLKTWLLPETNTGKYTMLSYARPGGGFRMLNDEQVYLERDAEGHAIRNEDGYVFHAYEGQKIPAFEWKKLSMPDKEAERVFRAWIYKNSLLGLFEGACIVGLIVMIGGTGLLIATDQMKNRRYERGKRVRGSQLVEPRRYAHAHKQADGLALAVKMLTPEGVIRRFINWMNDEEPTYELRMKRTEEAQGALILGDIGSGKSQILHRYLEQIARRTDEAAIVYDPACEFIQTHYRPQRGDIILNPLDRRAPFWSPEFECRRRNKIDYLTLADSFFPGRGERTPSTERFFNDAARDIFARMLEQHPDPEQLVVWLSSEKKIRELTKGTELAHYIDPEAKGQKGGVLATLGKVGKTLRLLPTSGECNATFSLSRWVEERRGWIFLTSNKETEERLRPLYAAYLDLLMRRLLSVDAAVGRARPVKLIVDEVHTLEYLPTLYKATTEGRKFGLHLIQGTQNKAQYDARYGQDATTMLSCPRYTILLRCKEPDSARWLSQLIGEEELEKPRTGVTASASDWGRDSINYASQTERRAVVSREEIAGLPDLAGYWKYGNEVVPFKFVFWAWKRIAEGFIPRPSTGPDPAPESETTIPEDGAPEGTNEAEEGNVWELLKEEN